MAGMDSPGWKNDLGEFERTSGEEEIRSYVCCNEGVSTFY